jgi:phage terminase large subunit
MLSADIERYISKLSPKQKTELDTMLKPELDIERNISLLCSERGWSPRAYQANLWDYLQKGGKRAVAIWHRRSGKDDVALNWTAEAAQRRPAEYWHFLPEAAQGRKAIWDAVSPHTGLRRIDQAFPLALREKTREQDMVIKFKNGSLWRVVGSDNYNSLMGSTPAGVVFSEWALADPNAWAFLRPILIENNGWAIFITTPRGNNHAKKTYEIGTQEPDWFAEKLSVEGTKVFTKEELDKELRLLQQEYGIEEGLALYAQEYECSFSSALIGAYYAAALARAQKEGRIGRVPIDRAVLVHTSWDLGLRDGTAIWFIQCVGKERRLVDYCIFSDAGLDEYVRILEEKRRQHGWIYGVHFFPHDIEHRELSNGGLSRSSTLTGLGVKPFPVPSSNRDDGINATRRLLDAVWIDEVRCEAGLNALSSYRRAWNEQLKMFSSAPLHDWASHGADALRMFACGYRDPKDKSSTVPLKLPNFVTAPIGQQGAGWMGNL